MTVEVARKRRAARAAGLKALRRGRLPVREALTDVPKALRSCPVYVVLGAAPGMGPQSIRKVLEERAKVWPLIPLGELTEMQRQAILDHLPERVD